MTLLVLLVLVVMWAAVLLPPWVRSRNEGRAVAIGSYGATLAVLSRSAAPALRHNGPTPLRASAARPLRSVPAYTGGGRVGPGRVGPAMTLRQARKRRRDILSGLLALAAVTLLAGGGIAMLRPLLLVHVVVDVVLVAYVVLLVRAHHEAAERELKVRFLPTAQALGGAARGHDVAPAASGDPLLLLRAGS